MRPLRASLAASFILATAAPAFAVDWTPPPVSAAHARQSMALPPSPCKAGSVECARKPALVAQPSADDLLCSQKTDGYACAPGRLVMCSGHKSKATQQCADGCNAAAHPPACVSSATTAEH
jgi:hypothetical protein